MGDVVEVTGKPHRRRGPGDLAGPGAAWVTVWVTATCPRHRPSFDRPVAVTRDGTGTLPLSKMSLQQNVCLKRFKHKQRPSALRKEKKKCLRQPSRVHSTESVAIYRKTIYPISMRNSKRSFNGHDGCQGSI